MTSNNSRPLASIQKDALSGLIVFLIALPLCLGIAQASQAPLFSGIIAGIVGGIVIGFFSNSQLSVSGPAAGLVAIVITAIMDFGAFDIFVCAVMVAGVIQLLFGYLRAGSIANYFPINVIEGMLAGIGLTIIIKQIPDAVGFVRKSTQAGMVDAEDGFKWFNISDALQHIQVGAVIIALIGIAILVLWQTKPMKRFSKIPAGLVVVVIGTLINELFKATGSPLYLDETHLVSLPIPDSVGAFFKQFSLPNFSGFLNPAVWSTGAIIAVVASIETLLCIEATDKMDPHKRFTSGNRELKAQGIGNMVSGLIGGLPITSVIVRSSANINAGAQSKASTIIHGALLLVCAALIPSILNLIPKASLAAILIYTGYRLCRPAIFKHVWKTGGIKQFIPFLVTAVAVVSLDLLKGVGLGMAISTFYLLRENSRIAYYFKRAVSPNGEIIKLTLAEEVSFLNKASIKETLKNLPANSEVTIDASRSAYIDYDVLDLIKDFRKGQAQDKNIKLSLIGFKNTYNIPHTQEATDPDDQLPRINDLWKKTSGGNKKLVKQLTEDV